MNARSRCPVLAFFLFSAFTCTLNADIRVDTTLALADELIIPAYGEFDRSAEAFTGLVEAQCRTGGAVDVDRLQEGFHQLMDRWQAVQWLRHGPAEFSFRHQRVQYWPDKHGSGGRQFRKLMNSPDLAKLEQSRFREGSVALQGLPVLERLLFASDPVPTDFIAADGSIAFRCHYLGAVAANLSAIAESLVRDYAGVYREALSDPNLDNPWFESSGVSVSHYLSQLATQLEYMIGSKLADPLGLQDAKGRMRLKRLESWRSSRSVRNLRINLETLHRVSGILLVPLIESRGTREALSVHWQTALAGISGLSAGVSGDDAELETLRKFHDSLMVLHAFVADEITVAIGVPLGFNSLDGD